jgi:nicotinate phosphoribosyltransferase
MVYDIRHEPQQEQTMVHPTDPTRRKVFASDAKYEDLLKPVVRNGHVTATRPTLDEIRLRRQKDLDSIHPSTLRFLNPHTYPVGLEASLHEIKSKMILEIRGLKGESLL